MVAANDTTYMVHPVRIGAYGYYDAEELRKYIEALAAIKESIVGLYAKKTGRDRDEVTGWMDATSWWTAATAKENGFVDELVGEEDTVVENRGGVLFVNSINTGLPFNKAPNFVQSSKAAPAAAGGFVNKNSHKEENNMASEIKTVLINVLDPEKHTTDIEETTIQVNDGVAKLEKVGVLLNELVVKKEAEPLEAGTDYTTVWNTDGTVNIVILSTGAGNGATQLTVSGKTLDPSKVTAEDIVGGVDVSSGKETGMEVIRQVYPMLGMTPGILIAPRYSMEATVAAALQAKTKSINSVFSAVCIVDINCTEEGAERYTDVKATKEEQTVSDTHAYAVWLYGKVGETVYSGSTLAAALTAYTDAVNDDTPNVSPSNKTIAISAACLPDGTEVVLDQEQANVVNSYGVATWLNMNGFRLWGNNTAAYPGITDAKDRWFSVRRFLSWAANSFILTYFQKVDSPANKRLIEAIVDSENVRGNGFVARGVCARYETIFNEDENTTTDLLNGKITFHQYITPFTPAEDIEDIIEFDPNALAEALV